MSEHQMIRSRVFIVGCGRSGTTLVQTLLATHPSILTFPESHFFPRIAPRNRWQSKLALVSSKSWNSQNVRGWEGFIQYLTDNGHGSLANQLNRRPLFRSLAIRRFRRTLDQITIKSGCEVWLEKHPGHFQHISAIEKYIPTAKFIHVIRNGPDTIASLNEAHPKWGEQLNVDQMIDTWVESVKIAEANSEKPNHMLIYYKDVTKDPEGEWNRMISWLGLSTSIGTRRPREAVAREVVLDRETWKKDVFGAISERSGHKFFSIFNENEQKHIYERLKVAFPDGRHWRT